MKNFKTEIEFNWMFKDNHFSLSTPFIMYNRLYKSSHIITIGFIFARLIFRIRKYGKV